MNGTEKEPLRHAKNGLQYQQIKLSEDLPMWCHIDLDELDRKRGRMNKLFFGPTPQNRQHALYLCGHDGPGFHVLCLRVMLLFSCIHSAQVSIVFLPMLARDESTTIFALIAYCVLAFIPCELPSFVICFFSFSPLLTSIIRTSVFHGTKSPCLHF